MNRNDTLREEYPTNSWTASWHALFKDAPDDDRRLLGRPGRFANVMDKAVNFYASGENGGDEVLELAADNDVGIFTGIASSLAHHSYHKQELFKGCAVWYGLNAVMSSGTAIEGGWGINARHVANPLAYVPGVGLRADYFANYTREQSIVTPLFTSFDDARMASTNTLNFADEDLRAKMLGDAIPAESFAAGANALRGFVNYEYLRNADHGWTDEDEEPKWRHSDIKNVDYRYVQDFFRHIKEATE